MSARKPKIQYYWTPHFVGDELHQRVNWRLVGANGEIMCQSSQGFRDKTDARRSVLAAAALLFWGCYEFEIQNVAVREVGPGRKP